MNERGSQSRSVHNYYCIELNSVFFTLLPENIMSLGQLTANYTDSEGEDDRLSDDTSRKSTPIGGTRVSELRDEGSRRGTPFSGESAGSGTPQKKVIVYCLDHNRK